MSIGHYNNYNYMSPNSNFRGVPQNGPDFINKPIEKVDKFINNTVDTFVKQPQDDEQKKTHKTAITAGSTVLVVSALVALLNPRFSGKFLKKFEQWTNKTGTNNKYTQKLMDLFQFSNSANACKDLGFKWLCTAEKFQGVKNENTRKVLQKCDAGFRKVMSGVHKSISEGFDAISKKTVYRNYNSATKNLNDIEELIKQHYTKNLSPHEQNLINTKLEEIRQAQKYFSKNNTATRLKQQEISMVGIDKKFTDKLFNDFLPNFKGPNSSGTFKQKMNHNMQHINNNMSFWAEDMLMPTRNNFEAEGKKAVDVLFGDGKKVRGKYNEIFDIISPHLDHQDKTLLEEGLQKAGIKLRKANKSECIEYFDKKRDLMLGAAPFDVITGIGGIGLSGIAVGVADTKEDRVSRALTLGFPAVAGIASNMAMTAMLFSGVQALVGGAVASAGLSLLGSGADKVFNPKSEAYYLAKEQKALEKKAKSVTTNQAKTDNVSIA